MSSKNAELEPRRSLTRPKFLRRISSKFTSPPDTSSSSSSSKREAALRERGLTPPSRTSTWPSPTPTPDYYDASAAKRRRDDALRERGLLPPVPASSSSPPSSVSPSRHSELQLREKGLLPPAIHRHLEDEHAKHGGECQWDATALVDEIRIERSLVGTRRTAAERIKAEWETRPRRLEEVDVTPRIRVESPRPPRPLSTPVSPSDNPRAFTFPIVASTSLPGPSRRLTTKDLPLLDTNPFPALTRSLSSPSLSGETLHARQPLELRVHSPNAMAKEMEKIPDKESRRMTMLAFM